VGLVDQGVPGDQAALEVLEDLENQMGLVNLVALVVQVDRKVRGGLVGQMVL
jgi:hypothetical protein